MTPSFDRRRFLAVSAAAGAGLAAARPAFAFGYKTRLHASLIGAPTEATLAKHKAAGFEGIESNARNATVAEAAAARKTAEGMGMRIHSLLRGWVNFNMPDKVEADIASVAEALEAAGKNGYGADAVLLVPCRIGGMEMPEPQDFDIEFDAKSLEVKRVVKGDNSRYRQYIEAQNEATRASLAAVRKLIPVAEKNEVVLSLENVWNNLWVKPAFARAFVAAFDSPWIKFYFDIGNHVKYAKAEEWIRTLGKLIVKVHVKDFVVDRASKQGGKFVDIRDGDVNWPAVRQALDEIGYNGWMTIEGSGGLSLEEQHKRLAAIIAGK